MVEEAGIDCAAQLHVLSDQTRLAVVRLLLDGPMNVSAMRASLGIEPTLLSHHLRVLREAEMVTTTRDGRFICYQLAGHLESRQHGRTIDFGCCRLAFDD